MSMTIYFHRANKARVTDYPDSHCTLQFRDGEGQAMYVFMPSEAFEKMQEIAEIFNSVFAPGEVKENPDESAI